MTNQKRNMYPPGMHPEDGGENMGDGVDEDDDEQHNISIKIIGVGVV